MISSLLSASDVLKTDYFGTIKSQLRIKAAIMRQVSCTDGQKGDAQLHVRY